nr:immunoglobulin light chain junction region [Macaca mulatta]
CQQGSNWTLTF